MDKEKVKIIKFSYTKEAFEKYKYKISAQEKEYCGEYGGQLVFGYHEKEERPWYFDEEDYEMEEIYFEKIKENKWIEVVNEYDKHIYDEETFLELGLFGIYEENGIKHHDIDFDIEYITEEKSRNK